MDPEVMVMAANQKINVVFLDNYSWITTGSLLLLFPVPANAYLIGNSERLIKRSSIDSSFLQRSHNSPCH
ncbi:hypothetical protein [Vibrio sp. F74]|uniref:hypothetical protein n=1 Tax=Vibrio sp. F74 TaxID=700020 RepID=UPI0035F5430C